VLEQVPGAFVFLGACPPDREPETAPTTLGAALFDDAALVEGTRCTPNWPCAGWPGLTLA